MQLHILALALVSTVLGFPLSKRTNDFNYEFSKEFHLGHKPGGAEQREADAKASVQAVLDASGIQFDTPTTVHIKTVELYPTKMEPINTRVQFSFSHPRLCKDEPCRGEVFRNPFEYSRDKVAMDLIRGDGRQIYQGRPIPALTNPVIAKFSYDINHWKLEDRAQQIMVEERVQAVLDEGASWGAIPATSSLAPLEVTIIQPFHASPSDTQPHITFSYVDRRTRKTVKGHAYRPGAREYAGVIFSGPDTAIYGIVPDRPPPGSVPMPPRGDGGRGAPRSPKPGPQDRHGRNSEKAGGRQGAAKQGGKSNYRQSAEKPAATNDEDEIDWNKLFPNREPATASTPPATVKEEEFVAGATKFLENMKL